MDGQYFYFIDLKVTLFFFSLVTCDLRLLAAKPETGVRHQQGGVREDCVRARGAAQRWVVRAPGRFVRRRVTTRHSLHNFPRPQPTCAVTSSPAAAWQR